MRGGDVTMFRCPDDVPCQHELVRRGEQGGRANYTHAAVEALGLYDRARSLAV